ncbi:MAG TPA: AmmeMemoRadiSam system protein B [Planctomycetes bacterium]|nr:AmmeMemoRadiSam system protein B [Planctomycetota bacterium]
MAGKKVRMPVRAGSFYPRGAEAVNAEIDAAAAKAKRPEGAAGRAVAAIAPHAGWTYSGPTAYAAIKTLLDHSQPRTVVVFGAVHAWNVMLPSITEADEWATPLGTLEVDAELREALLGSGLPLEADEHAHHGEHSIEVLLPFVQALSGKVRILPVAAPPMPESIVMGRAIAEASAVPEEIVALASTDLTHYGPNYYGWAPQGVGEKALKWVKEVNDRAVIEAMLDMREADIIENARRDHSACGAGAAAAAAAFAKAMGADAGLLVDYTTSYDAHPDGAPSDFVGYAGIVYMARP